MINVSGEMRRFSLNSFFSYNFRGFLLLFLLTNHGDRTDYFGAYQMLHVTFIFVVFLNIRFAFGTWRRLKFP